MVLDVASHQPVETSTGQTYQRARHLAGDDQHWPNTEIRVPASPRERIAEIVSDAGWEALEEMQIHLPRLDEALERYLRFGGLPAAVAEAIGGASAPSEETKKVLYDSLLREILRKRASRPAAHALLERVLHSVAHDLAPGLALDVPALVENAIALALYHRYESPTSRLEGFDAPAELHVWQTRRAGEIDFVCGPRSAPDLVEVKYQSSPDLRRVAAIPRAFPGRPVLVATKHRLERRGSYALVPAALLLWALG